MSTGLHNTNINETEQQQQQTSLSPKILGLTMDPQQTSQGRPHALFSAILVDQVLSLRRTPDQDSNHIAETVKL